MGARWEWQGGCSDCRGGLTSAGGVVKEDIWVEFVADSCKRNLGRPVSTGQSYPSVTPPVAWHSRGVFSWLPQRGCPDLNGGMQIQVGAKKSEPCKSEKYEWDQEQGRRIVT